MKVQDIIFVFILVMLGIIRKPRLVVVTATMMLLFAMLLYSRWVFFTAERLVLYSACLYMCALVFHYRKVR